jgi:hypothetical protein
MQYNSFPVCIHREQYIEIVFFLFFIVGLKPESINLPIIEKVFIFVNAKQQQFFFRIFFFC